MGGEQCALFFVFRLKKEVHKLFLSKNKKTKALLIGLSLAVSASFVVAGCGNKQQQLTIPETVKEILPYALSGATKLTYVDLNKVENIGASAFSGCTNLYTLLIPGNVANIGAEAFSKVAKGIRVQVDWETPLSIGNGTFSNAETLEEGEITGRLFVPTGTKDLYVAAQGWNWFQFIENGTISDYAARIITFVDPKTRAVCVAAFDADEDGYVTLDEAEAVTSLGDAFKGAEIGSFDEFKYFVNVKTIPTRGFSNCTALQTITLPESLEELQFLSFSGCNSLRTIELPVSLKIIGQSAFSQSGINTLFVPKNVNSISYQIVSRCPNLVSLSVDKENQWYDSREGCNAVIRKSDDTLISGSSLTQIPEGVKGLGFGCFSENFETLVLPSTLEEISSSLSCPRLKQLVSKAVVPPTLDTNIPSTIE